MKIAIIGYGIEGQAAYKYWRAGNEITICDQKPDLLLPDDVAAQLGPDYLYGLADYDVIVRSPFVRPDAITAANPGLDPAKITSCTNEFMRVCPTKNVIGITGTKGKGTTSTLITRILEAAGKRVHLGGNIGVAALELLRNDIRPDAWVVLELSSYQLLDMRRSPHMAACLMVMPEHLDWHIDVAEYTTAKQQLFRWQQPDDLAVYYPANELSTHIVSASAGQKIPYLQQPGAYVLDDTIMIEGQSICRTDELKLLGTHNWQNVCAAITLVWRITQDVTTVADAVRNFSGLPFRIEYRRTVHDVAYYNDSFATGPGACLAAMQAVEGPKVMILGGHDRGLDLQELIDGIADQGDNIRQVLIIGDSRQRLASALDTANFTKYVVTDASTMTAIVDEATALANAGDTVVLSPGFASFGLFENFEDRGRKFNAAVEAL